MRLPAFDRDISDLDLVDVGTLRGVFDLGLPGLRQRVDAEDFDGEVGLVKGLLSAL